MRRRHNARRGGVHPLELLRLEEEQPRDAESVVDLGVANRFHHFVARPWWTVAVGARGRTHDVHAPAVADSVSNALLAFRSQRPVFRCRREIDDEESFVGHQSVVMLTTSSRTRSMSTRTSNCRV